MKARNLAFAILFALLVVFVLAGRVTTTRASAATDDRCGKCGDGYCNPRCGETATSCPRDCGVVAE